MSGIKRRCPADFWNEQQLLEKCEGFQEFSRGEVESSYLKTLRLLEVEPQKSLLDIGCGRGEIIRKCSEITDLAIGIDYSAAAVKIAGAYTGQGKIMRASATHLPFNAMVFNEITMLGFIECLCADDLELCLEECKRVLKPGGRILITTPNSLGNTFFRFLEKVYGWAYHPQGTRPDSGWYSSPFVCSTWNSFSLKRMLKKHDFKVKIWYEPPRSGRIRSFLHRILFFTGPIYCYAYR